MESSCTAGGNGNWKIPQQFLKRLNVDVPNNLAIPLLAISPREFIITKKWKKPKCPSTDEWINKMYYIYIMEHYSAIKRNELIHATTSMNLKNIIVIGTKCKRPHSV